MADEKDIIVEFLKGKSASKSKFYFKDFTELFQGPPRSEEDPYQAGERRSAGILVFRFHHHVRPQGGRKAGPHRGRRLSDCRAVVPPAPATVRPHAVGTATDANIIRYAAKYRSGACALPYPTEMPRAIAAFPFSARMQRLSGEGKGPCPAYRPRRPAATAPPVFPVPLSSSGRDGQGPAPVPPPPVCARAALLYLPVTAGLAGPVRAWGNVPCTGLNGPASPYPSFLRPHHIPPA